MRFTVFDVGHGFCAQLWTDGGNVMLFDCGHDPAGFRPSRTLTQLGTSGIEFVVISHFDEDHVSDFTALAAVLPIQSIHSNPTLAPDTVRLLKRQQRSEIGPGLDALLGALDTYHVPSDLPALDGIQWNTYWVRYPSSDDINNLSLVSVIHYPQRVSILIPGDIEVSGWAALMELDGFRRDLACIDVFVTSHHGRSNGYYTPLFECCRPDVFITSDTDKEFATQEQRYDQHASGLPFTDGVTRKVLTTRSHGHITINAQWNVPGYRVQTGQDLRLHYPEAFDRGRV